MAKTFNRRARALVAVLAVVVGANLLAGCDLLYKIDADIKQHVYKNEEATAPVSGTTELKNESRGGN